MMLNKGLLLVRHETGNLSAFDVCNDVICYNCSGSFQPEFAERLPWMECDSLKDFRSIYRKYSDELFDLEVGIHFRDQAARITCHRCGDKINEVVLKAGAELPFTRLLMGVRSLWQQENRKQRLLALMQSQHSRLGSCSAMRDLGPALLQSIARGLDPPLGPDRVWQKQLLLALMQAHHPRLGASSEMRFLDAALLQSIAESIFPPGSTAHCKPRYNEPQRWPGLLPRPIIIIIPDDDAVVAAAAAHDTMDGGSGGGWAAADAAAFSADAGGAGTRDCLNFLCLNDSKCPTTLKGCLSVCMDVVCAADIGAKTAGDDAVRVIENGSPRGDADGNAANSGGPGSGSTESQQQLEVSGIKGRSAYNDQIDLLTLNYRLAMVASNKLSGSVGENGISGSIGPAGLRKIFFHLGLEGRSIMDWGAGNGYVIIAAGCYGASVAYGVELAANVGNFDIFAAARHLIETDPKWKEIKDTIRFDLKHKLMQQDIETVTDLKVFILTFCT